MRRIIHHSNYVPTLELDSCSCSSRAYPVGISSQSAVGRWPHKVIGCHPRRAFVIFAQFLMDTKVLDSLIDLTRGAWSKIYSILAIIDGSSPVMAPISILSRPELLNFNL